MIRAKEALGEATTRGTVEEALRRAVEGVGRERSRRTVRQRRCLDELSLLVDLAVLRSDESGGKGMASRRGCTTLLATRRPAKAV